MQQKILSLEDFFWKFLLINPMLDVANGIYIKVLQTIYGELYRSASISVTPSLVVRMAVLLLFVAYILLLKDKKTILSALPIGAAWALSVVSEFLIGAPVSLFTDVQYFARFCYNIAVVFVYCRLFERSEMSKEEMFRKLSKIISLTLILLSISIIIPYIFNMGFTTYADRFGFRGSRGFFYSGNDITGMFMLLLPVATCYFLVLPEKILDKKSKFFYGIGPAMTIMCMCLIGTKTSFAAVFITIAAVLVYAIIHWKKTKDKTILKRLGYMALLLVMVFCVVALASQNSVVEDIQKSLDGIADAAEESTATVLMSGRQHKLAEAFSEYIHSGFFGYIFGIGRGSQELTIEMDLFEVFFYYGIFGFVAMLWVYFKLGITFVRKFFKSFNLLRFGVFISLGLCAGYLAVAGHVLFSVTSGFYFSFMLVYSQFVFNDTEKLK